MIKHLILIISTLLFGTTNSIAQILKFEEVKKLPSSINSETEESMPLISSDGKTMYFVRSFHKDNKGGKFAGQDIWSSQKDDSVWSKASNQLGVLNNKKNNAVIGLNDDNQTIYLLDSYGGTVHGIAFSRLINEKWTKPENIPIKGLSKEGFMGFYMSPSYDVLLISMVGHGSYGEEDLYVSIKGKSNRWSEASSLGATINTSGYEISPFLSNDQKYLFFSSNGHPGFGNADLFVSERLYNSWDVWSAPKNLGPVINSTKFDAYFSMTLDSTAYFISNRHLQFADIYKSTVLSEVNVDAIDKSNKLHNEADALLSELRKISSRNIIEKIIFFEYNQFVLNGEGENIVSKIFENIKDLKNYQFSIEVFSFEGYNDIQKTNINKKRINSIRSSLNKKGVTMTDIKQVSFKEESMRKLSDTKTGGVLIEVRKKLSY